MQRITIFLGILLGVAASVFFLAPVKKEKWVGLQWTQRKLDAKKIDSLQRAKVTTLTVPADSEGVWIENTRLAQEQGLSVVVLPNTEFLVADSEAWFGAYRRNMLVTAQQAQQADADVICVGRNVQRKLSESQWHSLLSEIKQVYSGKLLYVTNWNELSNFHFWEELDCIGIVLPFRVATDSASRGTQMSHWATYIHSIEKGLLTYKKPIFILEEHDGSATANRSIRNQRREIFFQQVWVRHWATRVFLSEPYHFAD